VAKGAAACFAEQAASVMAMSDGVLILNRDVPARAPEDLRNRRREMPLISGIEGTFLLLLATT